MNDGNPLASLLAALEAATRWFGAVGVPYAVVGGVAASLHGRPREYSGQILSYQKMVGQLQDAGNAELRGRLVETAVGAHLVNGLVQTNTRVGYWREGDREGDFVVDDGRERLAIEVESGRPRPTPPGLAAFERAFGPCRKPLVGTGGLELETFFTTPPTSLP